MGEMSKFLETFPPDIQEAAWSEVNGSHGYIDSTEGAVSVARAILAERKRCAAVARRHIKYPCPNREDEIETSTAEEIEEAILKP